MVELDRPVAGPSLSVAGGLVLLLVGLLVYEPGRSPNDAYSLVIAGPALGALVGLMGIGAYVVPRLRLVFGTVTIPLAVLGLFMPALGLLVGPALGISGGALCLYFESRTDEGDRADHSGWPGWLRRNYWAVTVALVAGAFLLAAVAPTFPGAGCPTPTPCQGACPAVSTNCYGASLWVVFLMSAAFTGLLTFRLRAQDYPLPMPA